MATPKLQVNVLNEEFSKDVRDGFLDLAENPAASSIVLISAKPDCFIAGADIKMLSACQSKEEIMTLAKGSK